MNRTGASPHGVRVAALSAAGLLAAAVLGGPSRAQEPAPAATNVVPLVMRTPHGGFNRMVVSVTVCEPGTDLCATLDDVMVDTGSTGLRLEASAVPAWLRLPPVPGPDGRPLAECLRFVHDTAWGSLRRADVRLGGLVAAGLPLQVIADGAGPQPEGCPRSDARPTSNGTLGLGPNRFDCSGACVQDPGAPGVFTLDGDRWVLVRGPVTPAFRLPNPASRLAGYGNGIVVELPAPAGGGAAEVVGTLTFGVGTAPNNGLGPAALLSVDAAGRFATAYGGTTYPDSYIDSGTETYILADDGLGRCPGLPWAYCATPARRLGAEMVGRDGARIPVALTVGDYRAAREARWGAAAEVAVAADPGSTAFVWGAPFFLGRRVAVVIAGEAVPGAAGVVGPLYAVR